MVRLEFSRGVYRPAERMGVSGCLSGQSSEETHGHSEATAATLRDDICFGSVVGPSMACSDISE